MMRNMGLKSRIQAPLDNIHNLSKEMNVTVIVLDSMPRRCTGPGFR
jgi:hypothetical protein